jgi:hypothetical protein
MQADTDWDAPIAFMEVVAFENLTDAQLDVLHARFLVGEQRVPGTRPGRPHAGRLRRGLSWSVDGARSVAAGVWRVYDTIGRAIAPSYVPGYDYYWPLSDSELD